MQLEIRMSAKANAVHAGISSEAVRAKTGKGWAEWFALLDKSGAAKGTYKEIAQHLQAIGGGPWWSQMVTVGYEQSRGLRVKHQTAQGFSASASKTIAAPIATLFAAWIDPKTRAKWFASADLTIRKRTANRSLRLTWGDGSHVDVMFYPKGPAKSQVTIEQRKLAGLKDVTRVKAFWAKALVKLKGMLEAPAPKLRKATKSRMVRKK